MKLRDKYTLANKYFWISIGIAIKVLLYIALYYQHIANYNQSIKTPEGRYKLYIEAFDTKSYILPAENLLSTGVYIETFAEPLSKVIRMPGYSIVYLIFRYFTDIHTAKNILIILQLLLSGASCYYLARIGYSILSRTTVFYSIFLLYGFSVYVSAYDGYILTESIATSSIIFALYLCLTSKRAQTNHNQPGYYIKLFIAGCWITLAIFMRPATAPLIGLYAVYVLISVTNLDFTNANLIKATYAVTIFLGVFLIAETAWITRNYSVFSKIIPFQYNSWLHKTDDPTKNLEFYSIKWMKALGEDCIFYEFNTLSSWLYDNSFCLPDYRLPGHIYSSKYNQDSLYILRDKFLSYNQKYGIYSSALGIKYVPRHEVKVSTDDDQITAATKINKTFEKYTISYIEEHPVQYYVTNRIRLLKKFLVHSGVGALPLKPFSQSLHETDVIGLTLKVFWAFLYWIVLAGGVMGILYSIKKPTVPYLLITCSTLYTLLVFPFLVQIIDTRFICMAYPFLAVLSGIVIGEAIHKLLNKPVGHIKIKS